MSDFIFIENKKNYIYRELYIEASFEMIINYLFNIFTLIYGLICSN